jgi:hypothetical protein
MGCAPALRYVPSTVIEKIQLSDKMISMLFRAHYTGKLLLWIIGWTLNPVAHSFHMEEEGTVRVPCFTVYEFRISVEAFGGLSAPATSVTGNKISFILHRPRRRARAASGDHD